MVKARMSHQRVMSNFPTGRMVGKVGLEIPVNAANPALKQRQRGKPFVKRTTATLRANQGARDKATLTAKVLLDGEAETLMRLRQLFMEWAHQAGRAL
jgi:hypothetical protein